MALTIQTEMRKEYLYARVDGEFEFQSYLKTTDVILEACAAHQATKLLADFRTITGEVPTLMERFQHAVMGAQKYVWLLLAGKIKPCRFAFVVYPPYLHPRQFGATVAKNRGLKVKATSDLKEAFEWLEVEPDLAGGKEGDENEKS